MRSPFPERPKNVENQVIRVIKKELWETMGTLRKSCSLPSCDEGGGRVLQLARSRRWPQPALAGDGQNDIRPLTTHGLCF
jgi:hypothetical protein